jgi:hypothetical protein
MRKISKKMALAVAGTTAVAVVGGGVAYAYWSSNGTGTGSAGTASGGAVLTITQTSAPADLAPGSTPGPVQGSVANTGTASGYVGTVTVSIAGVSKAAGATGSCTADDYVLANPTMTVHQEIAAGGSVGFSGATLGFVDKPDVNQDGCKGATVSLAYASN